jgi:hypothetical protein
MAQARQFSLTEEQRRDLLDCREHHPKAYMREKAAAILKVAQGQAVRQVAAHGLLRPRLPKKVGQLIDRYLAEGRAGLLVRKGRGRKPAFFPSQPRRGQEQLYRSPHFCGLTCSRWSQERLRQTVPWMRRLSLPGISKLLRRLGVNYQRGRRHITSPDPLYEQKIEAIAQARMLSIWLPERFVFLYEDEHTYGRQPSAAKAYGKRGGPTPSAMQAPRYWTKRRIAGCLDVHTGALISRERSRFNVREMAEFFLLVEKQYPDAERIFIAPL